MQYRHVLRIFLAVLLVGVLQSASAVSVLVRFECGQNYAVCYEPITPRVVQGGPAVEFANGYVDFLLSYVGDKFIVTATEDKIYTARGTPFFLDVYRGDVPLVPMYGGSGGKNCHKYFVTCPTSIAFFGLIYAPGEFIIDWPTVAGTSTEYTLLQPVPEPSTAAFVGLGLAGVLARIRRREVTTRS